MTGQQHLLRSLLIAGLTAGALAGCYGRGTDDAAQFTVIDPNMPATFQNVNAMIFQPMCSKCHGEWFSDEKTLLGRGSLIVPGKPSDSLILQMVESGQMPKGGSKLSDEDIDLLRRYVMQVDGAPKPAPSPVPKAEATYAYLKTNLVQKNCLPCHSTANAKPGEKPALDTLEGLQTNAMDAYNAIDTGDMPPAPQPGKPPRPAVTQDAKDALYEWIQLGYPETAPAAAEE